MPQALASRPSSSNSFLGRSDAVGWSFEAFVFTVFHVKAGCGLGAIPPLDLHTTISPGAVPRPTTQLSRSSLPLIGQIAGIPDKISRSTASESDFQADVCVYTCHELGS